MSGFCAGSGNQSPSKRLKFIKVLDGRKQPIRGLWKRGDKFYARLAIRDASGNEQDKRVPLSALTVADAREELASVKKLRRLNILPTPQRAPFLSDYLETYLRDASLVKRPRTVGLERTHLNHWGRSIGHLRLGQIAKRHLLLFRSQKLSEGWSRRTANLSIVALGNLLKHAIDAGWLSSLPTEGVKQLKHVPKRKRLFAWAEIEAVCSAAIAHTKNGQTLADYIKLMCFCGSRRDETLRLKWSDVDWDNLQLTIGSDGLAKNHHARTVDFNDPLANHLQDMKRRVRNDSEWLFTSPRIPGGTSRFKTMMEGLRTARKESGHLDFGFHHCRVYFASSCVMSGVDFPTTAAWLGHRDQGFLLSRVYARLNNQHRIAQSRIVRFS